MSEDLRVIPDKDNNPLYVECEFTVEQIEGLGGDWQSNIGGTTKEKRVRFKGFATNDLYESVMGSIKDVLS